MHRGTQLPTITRRTRPQSMYEISSRAMPKWKRMHIRPHATRARPEPKHKHRQVPTKTSRHQQLPTKATNLSTTRRRNLPPIHEWKLHIHSLRKELQIRTPSRTCSHHQVHQTRMQGNHRHMPTPALTTTRKTKPQQHNYGAPGQSTQNPKPEQTKTSQHLHHHTANPSNHPTQRQITRHQITDEQEGMLPGTTRSPRIASS